MKIDIQDSSGELSLKRCEFPPDCKFFGEDEFSEKLRIYIRQDTLKRMDKYLSSDKTNELGGVLVGDVCVNSEEQNFILIDNIIIAEHTNSSVSRLTFTHETWDHINGILEKDHPEKKILGWFHSHPGHTVFLSNYDIFIQENFFNMEHMVAYVYDPTINERGFFSWRNKKIIKSNGYFVCDVKEEDSFEELVVLPPEIEMIALEPEVKEKRKLTFDSKNFITLGLLLMTILLLLLMVYNYYDLKKNTLLKEEYSKDLAEIRNENQKLSERLNDMTMAYELKKRNLAATNISDVNSPKVAGLEQNKELEKPEENQIDEKNKKRDEIKEEAPKVQETPEATGNVVRYVVKSGDTIEKISNHFYKSRSGIELILKHNNIKNKASIKIGQELQIPGVNQ